MKAANLLILFCGNLYLIWMTKYVMGAGMSNFKIEEYYLCEEVAVHKLHFFVRPKNSNAGKQLVDINMSLPLSIGNDAMAKILFELDPLLTTRPVWTHLFETSGELCKMIDTYMGEFCYDMQRAMGVMPHSCPLPRGSYHAVNYLMDFNKLKLQTFPFGKIRITIKVIHKTRPDIQGCVKIIVSTTDYILYVQSNLQLLL